MLQELPTSYAEAIGLFYQGEYEAFERFLTAIPAENRFQAARDLAQETLKLKEQHEAMLAVRRIAHHPHFAPYFELIPTYWQQAIFFTNLPFLRTRVHLSFFDHPKTERREIDYSYVIMAQDGSRVGAGRRTIRARETHAFELADLLPNGPAVPFGTLYLETVERDLGSLRIYACWYNDNSMTTTHEKGALANKNPLLVFPTIVCSPRHETFLAMSNVRDEPLTMQCQLKNLEGETHPRTLGLTIKSRGAGLIPISQHFSGASEFLRSGPGSLYVMTNGVLGIYYYFVCNTKLNTWQIQHI